jgi:hypothetical protein
MDPCEYINRKVKTEKVLAKPKQGAAFCIHFLYKKQDGYDFGEEAA